MEISMQTLVLLAFALYGAAVLFHKNTPHLKPRVSWGDRDADLVKPNRRAGRISTRAANEETADTLIRTTAS